MGGFAKKRKKRAFYVCCHLSRVLRRIRMIPLPGLACRRNRPNRFVGDNKIFQKLCRDFSQAFYYLAFDKLQIIPAFVALYFSGAKNHFKIVSESRFYFLVYYFVCFAKS